MSKIREYVLMLLGASAIGVALPSDARAESNFLEEQRACEEALRIGTVRALEQFLRDYPRGSSACRALALNALGETRGEQSSRGNPRNNGYN
jgi:hypothetical protein